MKLQTFSLSLLLLSIFWSQCFSASSCKMANWWGTFDHKGWSTCDSSTEYITGLWRNDPAGDDEIHLLEEAKCCTAPTPYESLASTCQTANWWGVLDGENVWAVCPTGYFLQGLWRNDGDGWIYKIEEAKCCKPNTLPDQYEDCFDENIWGSFDHKGLSQCLEDDYYVAGFYKSDCEKIYCIEKLKCCRMSVDFCKYANPCKNGGTCSNVSTRFGADYSCECPSGYYGKTCQLDDYW